MERMPFRLLQGSRTGVGTARTKGWSLFLYRRHECDKALSRNLVWFVSGPGASRFASCACVDGLPTDQRPKSWGFGYNVRMASVAELARVPVRQRDSTYRKDSRRPKKPDHPRQRRHFDSFVSRTSMSPSTFTGSACKVLRASAARQTTVDR